MRGLPALSLAVALATLAPVAAPAQDGTAPAQDGGDKGFLVNFLEDSLSDAGRKVEITGFAGALSSRATLQRLTIADDQGVWLEVDDAVLDWSRTALLSGQVIINELSAGRIALARIPSTGEAGASPEAGSFILPELPVSIDIGAMRAERVELGAPVLGEALVATLDASLHLAGGEGSAALHLSRTDPGPAEVIDLKAGYANTTGALSVDFDAQEGAGGLLSHAIGLPRTPPMDLSLKGDGTIDDFSAVFRLATEGEERLAGPITLSLGSDGARTFSARVRGNPAPLFAPEYAGFLGTDLGLTLTGRHHPDGRTEIDGFTLDARALALAGKLSLAADGLPEAFDLSAHLAEPGGGPVLLPLAGPPTRVSGADIALRFDATQGSGWTASATLADLSRPGLNVKSASITGAGTITRAAPNAVDGRLDLALTGLAGIDPALLVATGADIGGTLDFRWQEGEGALDLPRISLSGEDYGLDGHLRLHGLDDALTAEGTLSAGMRDLGRLSALAGRPLGGAGTLSATGEASPLTGAFDLSLTLAGQDLRLGIPQVDRLLAGQSTITATARRDESGITLRELSAGAASLRIDGAGTLSSGTIHLKGAVDWRDLSDLGPGYGGSLATKAGFDGLPEDGTLTLDGIGNGLRVGQAKIDRMIAGQATLTAEVALAGGVPALRRLRLNAPALTATAAQAEGSDTLDVTGNLADLALIVDGFPGAVTLDGQIRPEGTTGQEVDLHLTGPASLDARLTGRIAARPDLALSLRADAALSNGITDPITLAGLLEGDLQLKGSWGLDGISGWITLADGRVAVPEPAVSLEQLTLDASVAGGRVNLAATANHSAGGSIRVEGPASLTAPFAADLSATLSALHLREPGLYDTTLDGALHLSGPLLGAARLSGTVDLGATELRVPSTGSSALADIERFRHRGDSAGTRVTRARAGVGAGAGAGGESPGKGKPGGPDWDLDLVIRAINRVFVRGRGLDAELGGAIRLAGSLHNPVPSGGMDLIRGRLDILGKRLDLARANLSLEGGFIPWLDVAATNASDGVTSTVAITGPANDPVVAFTSEPELPQEEVLAHLLFGRGLGKMSAFQAAQLASAVATLAGKGGEGIIGRLRTGLGLDDLDITTAESGEAEVKAGKYLSENIYSELSTDQNGDTRIDLNLIVRPGVTLRGRAGSAGDSGLGIYLEGDY